MAYSIKDAAALLGLHPKTLRRWEDKKKFIANRTLGNQRRFSDKDIAALRAIKEGRAEPVIYDRILTLEEAAKKLNVSPDTIRRWTKQGKLALTVNDQLEAGYSEKALDKLVTPQIKVATPPPTKPPILPPVVSGFPLPKKWQKPFVYATLATILATAGILAYLLILKPPFLANPSVEQLDLTKDIEVALPRTASFLDGHITIGTDTGDYSFLDQNANLYVKNQALIEGSVTTGSLQLLPSEQPENQIGRLYVNQDSGDLLYFDGLAWVTISGNGANGNPTLQDVYNSGDTTLVADNQDIDITLGNNATASATSLRLTLAGVSSAFQILGGASQEIATFDDDALYPVTISQPTQVLANLYARQFIDSDNVNYYLDPANSSVSLAVAGDATIASTLTFRTNGEYLTNSTNDYLISSGGLGVGGSTSYGISSDGHGNFKKGNFEETLTAAATFDANGQIDLGDGGETITLDGSSITYSDFISCTALETNGSGVLVCGSDDGGGDATTLDGLDSTQFLRSDTSDSFTSGTLTLDAGTTLAVNGTLDANGVVTLGDGGDAITIDGSALTLQTTGAGSDITLNPVDDIILTDFTTCTALETDGSGILTCGSDDGGASTAYWRLSSGALSPINDTLDLLIGGSSSESAKFAFINVNSGTPTASIAGNLTLNSAGVIQTTNNQTLTIGGNTTGNLTLAEDTAVSGSLTLTGTLDANGQADIGDGGDSITLNGNAVTLQTTGAGSDITLNPVDDIILTDLISCTALETDGSGIVTCGTDDTGGDATTLDGLDSTQFLRSDTSDSFTSGTLTFDAGTTLAINGTLDANGQVDLGDGGDSITLNGNAVTLQTTGAGTDITLNAVDDIILTDFTTCTALETDGSGILTCGTDDGGGDATTLDGLDSTQFLRSDTSDSFTSGTLTLDLGTTLDINGDLSIADTNISLDGATTTFTQTTGGLFLDAGGTTAVTIKDNLQVDGAATISGTTTFNTITYTWPGTDAAASGYSLTSNGSGTLSWTNVAATVTNYWRLSSGALSPVNDTLDLLIGGSASTSADFAFLNVNSGTPTASFSGNLVLNSAGVIQTTNNQTLTIGGDTTGDLTLAENTAISGTLDANGQVDLGDGGDAITLNGSSITLTGFASCTALETNGSGVLTCGSDDGGASTAYWRLSSGALSPINDTLDLLIGGSSSESAKFAFINVNSGTPTASIAGNLTLNSAGVIQTTNNQTLTIGGSSTGDLTLAENTAVSGSLTLTGLSAGVDNTVLVLNSSNQVVTDEIDSRVWGTSLIDGSGNAGYLAYFTDGDTLANSLLYQASGKVGLGTTSLIGLLNVDGSGGGNALAIFNETAGQDIITASASGVTKFRVDTNGYVIAQRFSDLADTTFYVDPAASGTSLNIEGNIVSNGAFSISSNGDNNITINAGTGTVLIGATGTGKLDAGTVDPPYTINGEKYATYLSGMTGVKEETTGVVVTRDYEPGIGYKKTIDFANLEPDSDLWLFTKVTNLKNNLNKLVVLLTPAGATRTWYTLDTINGKLNIHSTLPTTVSYRLTAPRFDANLWANTRNDDHAGFIINDEGEWQENLAGTIIGDTGTSFFDDIITAVADYFAAGKIISPVVETENLATNFISPIIAEEPIVIDADVSVSGTLTADQIESSTITNLRDKIADLAEYYRQTTATAAATPSDPVSDDLAIQLLTPSSDASASAYLTIENLEAKAGFFSEYLAVIGQTTLTDVKINNLLTVNSVTSANGAINFLAGLMTLDATGKIYINGDVNIAGNLAVSDTIIASQIAPPENSDLSVRIASQSAVSIYNLIDTDAVASIDASGSGSFSRLNLKASGTATISAGLNSIAVPADQITPSSQVIVTFTSNYAPATKYWVTKEPELKLFNVFVNYPVNEETTFDWLLIN